MELKQIKELMAAMEKASIKKLSIKEKSGFELHLEKQDDFVQLPARETMQAPLFHPPAISSPRIVESLESAPSEEKKPGRVVTSPMVGTFYLAASPEDAPFVKVGDTVGEGSIVCIIEAMKVMNEVKAGISGTISEVCVENGHPVEFGTPLFRIV